MCYSVPCSPRVPACGTPRSGYVLTSVQSHYGSLLPGLELMGDASDLYRCVWEAERRGCGVWVSVILGVGMTKQFFCMAVLFFLPWKTSPD